MNLRGTFCHDLKISNNSYPIFCVLGQEILRNDFPGGKHASVFLLGFKSFRVNVPPYSRLSRILQLLLQNTRKHWNTLSSLLTRFTQCPISIPPAKVSDIFRGYRNGTLGLNGTGMVWY